MNKIISFATMVLFIWVLLICGFCPVSMADGKTTCAIDSKNCSGGPIADFDSCVAAGNKVLKTYPGRCVDGEGKVFVQKAPPQDAASKLNGEKFCIDNCGNGKCEEIVCQGSGCPCAESAQSCPQDCQ